MKEIDEKTEENAVTEVRGGRGVKKGVEREWKGSGRKRRPGSVSGEWFFLSFHHSKYNSQQTNNSKNETNSTKNKNKKQ